MRVASLLVGSGFIAAGTFVVLAAQAPSPSQASDIIDTYCAGCHTGTTRSPSTRLLERFDPAAIADSPQTWSRVYRQLQAGTMPPFGARRPNGSQVDAALREIEQALGIDIPAPTLTSLDIATRLATVLWNDVPDVELRREAERGRLTDPKVIEGQVRRMLADQRAVAFVSNFFFPWLQLDELANENPDPRLFPDYDPSLRTAFARETELFLLSQLRDDRDPIELWSASYSFLNEQLARHYGVSGVSGPDFRRVSWPSSERAGLLGQGSILMLTSRHQEGPYAAYTSPAERSKWIRLHFFGAALPGGFPGAQPVSPEYPITPQVRALPATPCVNCHRNFFPLAYGLENFDPLGRWRTRDQSGPVDASGVLSDGTPFNGAAELKAALVGRSEAFRTNIVEKLIVFASDGWAGPSSGTPDSLVAARRVLRSTAPRWSALIAAVVRNH
ncbi:MAG: DUF1592 domain-containing protein [Vicinamibacterales bacterium]